MHLHKSGYSLHTRRIVSERRSAIFVSGFNVAAAAAAAMGVDRRSSEQVFEGHLFKTIKIANTSR